jgi:hypothetical protein
MIPEPSHTIHYMVRYDTSDLVKPDRVSIRNAHDDVFHMAYRTYFAERFREDSLHASLPPMALREVRDHEDKPIYAPCFDVHMTLDTEKGSISGHFLMTSKTAGFFLEFLRNMDAFPMVAAWQYRHLFDENLRYKGPENLQGSMTLISMAKPHDLQGLVKIKTLIAYDHSPLPVAPASLTSAGFVEVRSPDFEGFLNPSFTTDHLHIQSCPIHLLPDPTGIGNSVVVWKASSNMASRGDFESVSYLSFYKEVHPIVSADLGTMMNYLDHRWACVRSFTQARLQGTLRYYRE